MKLVFFFSCRDGLVHCDAPPLIVGGNMNTFVKCLRRFLVSEDGPTAVEYAVMLALIVVVCITAITAIGTAASSTFSTVSNQMTGS